MDSRAEFLTLMERVAALQGLTPIAARILGVLLFDGAEMSFSELAEELQVSRGSISTNTRMLVDGHVIARIRHPGQRQDYFRVAPELFSQLMAEWARGMAATATAMRELSARMPSSEAAPKDRIDALATFYEHLAESMGATPGQIPDRN